MEETTRRINQNSYFLTHSANPVLGDLVQGMIQEMWGKQEFYQESVKGYLRAFPVSYTHLDVYKRQCTEKPF